MVDLGSGEGAGQVDADRARRVAWVASRIMPHEPGVRRWLARSRLPHDQIADLVQEAYCRFAAMASLDHITQPQAYFFQIIRSLIVDKMRQARVVRIETVTEIEALPVITDEPSSERIVAARRELAEVMLLISQLPDRCRSVFQLRKIEGLSQKEIAAKLGVTETIVENDVAKGMRIISRALREGPDRNLALAVKKDDEKRRDRRRD